MKSIAHHLKRWRHEPEARRERRALLLASGITLCLFVLWLVSFRLAATLRSPSTVMTIASVGAVATTPAPGIIERIQAGWRTVIK